MCMGRTGITTSVATQIARRGLAPPAGNGNATTGAVLTLLPRSPARQFLELVERRVRLARRKRIRVERGQAIEHGGVLCH
jgi:hypothetical protein